MIHNYFIIKILWQIDTAISHPVWEVQKKHQTTDISIYKPTQYCMSYAIKKTLFKGVIELGKAKVVLLFCFFKSNPVQIMNLFVHCSSSIQWLMFKEEKKYYPLSSCSAIPITLGSSPGTSQCQEHRFSGITKCQEKKMPGSARGFPDNESLQIGVCKICVFRNV